MGGAVVVGVEAGAGGVIVVRGVVGVIVGIVVRCRDWITGLSNRLHLQYGILKETKKYSFGTSRRECITSDAVEQFTDYCSYDKN